MNFESVFRVDPEDLKDSEDASCSVAGSGVHLWTRFGFQTLEVHKKRMQNMEKCANLIARLSIIAAK